MADRGVAVGEDLIGEAKQIVCFPAAASVSLQQGKILHEWPREGVVV